jgi:hypothetical protein
MVLQKTYEVKQVGCLKGPVLEREKLEEILLFMLLNELEGGHIHQAQQFIAFFDDSRSVSPCKNCSKESCDFYVLSFAELMGD